MKFQILFSLTALLLSPVSFAEKHSHKKENSHFKHEKHNHHEHHHEHHQKHPHNHGKKMRS